MEDDVMPGLMPGIHVFGPWINRWWPRQARPWRWYADRCL